MSRAEKFDYSGETRMARMVQFDGRPVWAEVSLGALAHNLREIRRHIRGVGPNSSPDAFTASGSSRGSSARGAKRKILAVVKGNAYGHGIVPVARALGRAGADWFGVTCSAEGMELRESGVRGPVLLLTGFWTGEERRILDNHLTPAITQIEQLRWLERAAARARGRRKPVEFHLKIDSGMNRLGLGPGEIPAFASAMADCPHLRLGGAFTHLASSEDHSTEQAIEQEKMFRGALDCLRARGFDPGIVHLANSGAIASRPSTWAAMVRPGAMLYGYHQFFEPAERTPEIERQIPLRPVLAFRARIISLRDVPAGASVGYNARWTAARASRIAVIAAGYADGVARVLTNRGKVIVRGQFAPIVGSVSMDLTMADVTDIPAVRLGDTATIFGSDGDARQRVSDVARIAETASAALLCGIGKRVPRFYLS